MWYQYSVMKCQEECSSNLLLMKNAVFPTKFLIEGYACKTPLSRWRGKNGATINEQDLCRRVRCVLEDKGHFKCL